jgi:hypothetical protein
MKVALLAWVSAKGEASDVSFLSTTISWRERSRGPQSSPHTYWKAKKMQKKIRE